MAINEKDRNSQYSRYTQYRRYLMTFNKVWQHSISWVRVPESPPLSINAVTVLSEVFISSITTNNYNNIT